VFAHELAGRVRVIAGLDQQPILFHSEKWPDYATASQELRRLRQRTGCGDEDALVVVWGPLEDTVTAANEIRLRYVDAADGVPNETRQPFRDGSTDFERILPGPDRMYPDTDSPPQRITRDRVRMLRLTLCEPPWEREARYRAVGVPPSTIHYLIRRGGARLVDRVVFAADTDLRSACFFFGERLKGLQRSGIPVDRIGADRWVDLFRLLHEQPTLWEAWKPLVIELSFRHDAPVQAIAAALLLKDEFGSWRDVITHLVGMARPTYPDGSRDQLVRFLLGEAMRRLRGRVPVDEVRAAIEDELEVAS
jgi:glutamyl-tRNA(Gln) amidotransferase subunit E